MSAATKLPLAQRAAGEAAGTFFLLAAVVGSGAMGERLSGGNAALALLANSVATGAALVALILAFGQISGAHFNPLVTLADRFGGALSSAEALAYIFSQAAGAFGGVAAANLMFGFAPFAFSQHARPGLPLLGSEFIATFGLVCVIRGCGASPLAAPFAVGGYIAAAYWFSSSTSFANPAVTLARSVTDTFAGIRPPDVPGFIAAQFAGAACGVVFMRWLTADRKLSHGDSRSRSDASVT